MLNQVRDGTGVTDREVREVLGAPVFASIERDDAAVQQSMNVGSPLGESGRSRFARGIARLTGAPAPVAAQPVARSARARSTESRRLMPAPPRGATADGRGPR